MHVIFETVVGSRAYGLDREGSDTDLRGVVVGPAAWYFGLHGGPEQVELGPDHVRFELRKFLRLGARSNPSVLETIFTPSEHHRVVTAEGELLLGSRALFLTKHAADAFAGYALGQLRRIRTHRGWLLDPPKGAPQREEFGLTEGSGLSRDQLGAAEALLAKDVRALDALAPPFQRLLAKEKEYRAARLRWKQYRQWQSHRNPARAALEAKYGYDTKHAMHLIRLLRMAVEITRDAEVRVHRDDRESLLAIRDGALGYEALVEQAEALRADVLDARDTSPLPDSPDEEALDTLCVTLIERTLR